MSGVQCRGFEKYRTTQGHELLLNDVTVDLINVIRLLQSCHMIRQVQQAWVHGWAKLDSTQDKARIQSGSMGPQWTGSLWHSVHLRKVVSHALVVVSFLVNGHQVPSSRDCTRTVPFLSVDQSAALCKGHDTTVPLDCARRARTSPGVQGELLLDLCAGARSEMPGICLAGLSRGATKLLTPGLRVALCKDAESDAPARCAEQLRGLTRLPQVLVDVCKLARSTAPADCFALLPPMASRTPSAARFCGRADSAGPGVCSSFRGLLGQYGIDVMTRLCADAQGEGPAECFYRAALATNLPLESRMELCKGALTDAPARCAEDVKGHRLSPLQRAELCRRAAGSGPARCAQSLPPTVRAEARVMVCQNATEPDPTAPAQCLRKVLGSIPVYEAVTLCAGASDVAMAECVRSARHSVTSADSLRALCLDASSVAPAACAKAAINAGADQHVVADLCHGADSLAPAQCFAEAPRQMLSSLRMQTCAGARSTAPSSCLEAAMFRSPRTSDNAAVCPLDHEEKRAPRRELEHLVASRLCKDAIDNSPAECAQTAPGQMDNEDLVTLCEASGLPKGRATARCATKAFMAGMSLGQAALLCRGAESDAPAACAATLSPWIGSNERLDICIGARSDSPGRCVNSLNPTTHPTPKQIEKCRTAIARPSGLHITSLDRNGTELVPEQPMQATLEIRDQWGGPMPDDHGTVVRASIPLKGSNGTFVNAYGCVNTTRDGVVHFDHISFSGPGSFTLHFSIDSDGGTSVPLAAVRVVVAETRHGLVLRTCASVFSFLSCPVNVESPRDRGRTERLTAWSIDTQAVSIAGGGMQSAWKVLACHRVLEENGVRVAFAPGGGYPLRAWLWYHPGIEMLEAGVGVPNREQLPWEILGVGRDANVRELRRAYYRLSLLWHPDRWVRHPRYTVRAQEIFELVGEAYAFLVGGRRREKQETS